jgi:hypothetical protein
LGALGAAFVVTYAATSAAASCRIAADGGIVTNQRMRQCRNCGAILHGIYRP